MVAITFPSSPTTNQLFTAAGSTWQWDGTAWRVANLPTNVSIATAQTIKMGNATVNDAVFINPTLVNVPSISAAVGASVITTGQTVSIGGSAFQAFDG